MYGTKAVPKYMNLLLLKTKKILVSHLTWRLKEKILFGPCETINSFCVVLLSPQATQKTIGNVRRCHVYSDQSEAKLLAEAAPYL